ncbi:MAG: putative serine/threonine-protein kinase Nek3 [Streblomastix strix]|uniref:non-specific serine/threonine protein kinase n=1 Tax=Streblomastix strix TaxID=222440 RepID=A0A5J4VTC6_9EUKA|nr:MAG: putative serine/threonine-protein kinase Nek3 [Streblomastix strix]
MIRKLQGGAQGKTFLVERIETNKLFVLKKVDYFEAEDIQKANREVEQMINLASPFTVLLVCVFPHDVELCLVMEYCEKGDLRKVMAELQQLPEEERLMRVWEILAQIFLAVDHLHSHDVIHRDIKPENIFVMADGSVRVGDFGLAKNVANKDYATAVGTRVYQAPEVYEQHKMTIESDVFAVGEVIFELLSGRHPFESRSELGMIEKICKGEIAPFPAYTEGSMKQIVLAMMNPNPSGRPQAKEVLSHDVVRMYLRLYDEKKNIVEQSGRIQILQQEKDREKQRADFAVQRILQIEQERDNEKRRVDIAEQNTNEEKRRADEYKIRADVTEAEITRLRLQLVHKDQEIQELANMQQANEITRSTIKDFSEQTQKQISGLHDDIKFLQENQKKLVKSFNQLRSFVEDFSQRIEQRINKQEAKIDTIEQRLQNLDMNMNRGPLIGNGPNLQLPGVPLVPVQQQPQMFPYKTIGPVVGTTPTQVQIQPQINPQTSIAIQQQRDNQYPAQEINELMNQTNFQVIDRDKANIQISGKAIKFIKNETVVFLDYQSLDNIVSITWRAYFQGETRFSYGFMMDNENVANNTQSLNTSISYNSNGNILVKQRREYSEPIRSGDLVRIELNNSEYTAQFFKNGVVLPFLIRKITPVNVFFVKAQQGVQVQLMDLREDPIAQASVPPRVRKDLDNY